MNTEKVLKSIKEIYTKQEEFYKYLHSHPELSMQEVETLNAVEHKLIEFGYIVQRIGGGVVGVMKNGEGKVVLHRSDMDALPIKEISLLPYASTVTQRNLNGDTVPVMHACGHDFHVTAGLGAAWAMAKNKDEWTGTYIALFQPGEELGCGAQSMVEDGLKDKIPHPNICFAQHVLVTPKSGLVGVCSGAFLSTAASIDIKVYGNGSHGSMPHLSVDTVVLAANIVTRLQTIVSREINPMEMAVLTVGALNAGDTSNIIPQEATIKINIRAYSDDVREHLIDGIKRIVKAECMASNSTKEPEFRIYNEYPPTINDKEAALKLQDAFKKHLGEDRVAENYQPMSASEDFSIIPNALGVPYVYWGFGGFLEKERILPNHNPAFAPDLHPTLETGTEAAIVAAMSYLAKDNQ
ncbi:MAG: amidohydrolase [Acholeplasmataceae bacterium]